MSINEIYLSESIFKSILELSASQCLDKSNDQIIKFTTRDIRNSSFMFNHVLWNYTLKKLISLWVWLEYMESESFKKRIDSFKKYIFYSTNISSEDLFKPDICSPLDSSSFFLQKCLEAWFEFAVQSDEIDKQWKNISYHYNYNLRDIQNVFIIFSHITHQYAKQNDLTLGVDSNRWLPILEEVIELSTWKTISELFNLENYKIN